MTVYPIAIFLGEPWIEGFKWETLRLKKAQNTTTGDGLREVVVQCNHPATVPRIAAGIAGIAHRRHHLNNEASESNGPSWTSCGDQSSSLIDHSRQVPFSLGLVSSIRK